MLSAIAQHRIYFVPASVSLGRSTANEVVVTNELGKIMKPGAVSPVGESTEPNYDVNYGYRSAYQDKLLKGRDVTSRPWNILQVIKGRVAAHAIATDVGCGTAYKSLRLSSLVRLLIGVEPNEEMIKIAVRNALVAGARNVCFVTGDYNALPFDDATIDLVMGFLAPHSASEIERVLKPGGWAVIERVGDRDKVNIKEYFGSDSDGPRGQLLRLEAGERARSMKREFENLFSQTKMRNGFWDTEYTPEELLVLLEQTPTVRNFSRERDRDALAKIEAELSKNDRVRTTQNRVLIVARK